jgi:membrane protein YqaA with SNARE-associated domain
MGKRRRILRWIGKLERFVDRWWYAPLMAALVAADLFVAVIPSDALVISSVMLRPKRWVRFFVSAGTGSAIGAAMLALLVKTHGSWMIAHLFPHALESPSWVSMDRFLVSYGPYAIFLVAVGPLPQQPAVVLAALAHMNVAEIAGSVLVGRLVKYGFFAWSATHAPRLMARLTGVRRESEALTEHARAEDPRAAKP